MTTTYETLQRFDNGTQSVTLAKRFDTLFEVSWFHSVEDAGMHTTRDEAEALTVYGERLAQLEGK